MDLSKFVAIIPARGGSKGIHKKNIVDIHGKPLISFTIEAAQELFNKEQIFVSTDSTEIADISTKFGANVPFLRPQEISQDSSSSIDLIDDFLKRYNQFEYIVLLQPTSPLRTKKHLYDALEMYHKEKSECLISVKEVSYTSEYLMKANGKKIKLDNTLNHIRRQEAEKRYYPNGAIYIASKNHILTHKSFFTNNTHYYLMDPISSIDIDNEYDLEVVRKILKK